MTRWLTWRRVWALGCLLLFIGAGAILLTQQGGTGCGNLIAGRWSRPLFLITLFPVGLGLSALMVAALAGEARARSIGQGMVVAGLATALSLALIDVGMRLTDPPRQRIESFAANHPTLGYFFTPDNRFTFEIWEHQGRANTFFTDHDGLIIRDGRNDPRPGATRLLFLGDSFVSGLQVPADRNFTVLAERLLDQASGADYQSINLGVDGYSPIRYYLAYQAFKDRFDPAIVIAVVYVDNDFTDAAALVHGGQAQFDATGRPASLAPALDESTGMVWINPSQGMVPVEEARPTIVAPEVWRRGLLPTFQYVVIGATCRRLAIQAAGLPDPGEREFKDGRDLACRDLSGAITEACVHYGIRDDSLIRNNRDAIYKDSYTPFDLEDIEVALDALRYLHEAAGADGRRLVLVIMPDSNQIPNQSEGVKPGRGLHPGQIMESTAPQRLMAEFCTAEGIECLDLLPLLLEYQDEMLFWVYDTHLTERGHEVLAEILAEYLLAR